MIHLIQMINMMGQFAEPQRNRLKYQTLTKVRLSKTQSKNRIGKIFETDPSSFWQDAEQLQDWQNS